MAITLKDLTDDPALLENTRGLETFFPDPEDAMYEILGQLVEEHPIVPSKETRMATEDMLNDAFTKQVEFMSELKENDLMPEFPVDLTSKSGQRLVKETIYNMFEEMFEASYILKNRSHRLTDEKKIDREHFREEIGDAFAYFMEVCVLAGIGPHELYQEFLRKNRIVKERLRKGY